MGEVVHRRRTSSDGPTTSRSSSLPPSSPLILLFSSLQCLEDTARRDRSRSWKYPLAEFSGVYNPSVFVLRSSEDSGYQWLPAPVEMSFVAVAAYRQPQLVSTNPPSLLYIFSPF